MVKCKLFNVFSFDHSPFLALFSNNDLEILAKEVSTMLSFKHTNVMSLIGVCIEGEMPLLIMPFMSNGSVLDYVRSRKDKLMIVGQFLKEEVNNNFKGQLYLPLVIV